MTFLEQVTEKISRSGGEITSVRHKKHSVIEFKVPAGRAKISCSSTPSDVNAIHAVERDIARRLEEIKSRATVLEAEPETVSSPVSCERIRQAPHPHRTKDLTLAVPIAGTALPERRKKERRKFREVQHDAHVQVIKRMIIAYKFGVQAFSDEKFGAMLIRFEGRPMHTCDIFKFMTRKSVIKYSWNMRTPEADLLRRLFSRRWDEFCDSETGWDIEREAISAEPEWPGYSVSDLAEADIKDAIAAGP